MKILDIIERFIARVVNTTLVLLFFAMLGLAITQVALRYFFHSSISFADVLARNLVMWVGLLGAILATPENKHFHIDVLTRFLNNRSQLWLRAITNLFSSVVCYFLGRAATTFLLLDPDTKIFLTIPAAAVESILPVSFYLMMVLFAIRTIGSIVEGMRFPHSSGQTGF